jgi:anti-sigma factor RsiW
VSVATPRELSCEQLVELVTDYLEGTLAPEDVAAFEAHLEECDGCRTYVDQMRETIAALGAIPPEPLSPEAQRDLLLAFGDWRRRR